MSKQRFAWKAVDKNGITQHGVWVGEELAEVQTRLRNEGYFPVAIRTRCNWKSILLLSGKNFQWNHFTRRLATLLEAGIPLLQALELMTFHDEKLTFQMQQWNNIKERVEAGSDLSEAVSLQNLSPDSFILSMIKVGEYTGTLGKALSEVADELDQEYAYRQKIKAVLAYPLLLIFAMFIVLYVLSVWVLPTYEELFISMDAELPFLTKVIFACGNKLPLILWSGLGLMIGCLLVQRLIRPDYWSKRLLHKSGRLPFIGKVYRLRDLVQFSRMLSRLLVAGIPLLEALHLTAEAMRDSEMHELIKQLVQHVRQGKSMASLLRASRIFPKEGAEMIALAEEAGKLEEMLCYITQMFRRELDDQLAQLKHMLEPMLILTIAGLIGLIAAGVMLPVFDLSSQLK
ncbi:MAG: type II secretion system F family protein [Desulfosporosinus sp.]|jgi:type II secretory pathway component PulF